MIQLRIATLYCFTNILFFLCGDFYGLDLKDMDNPSKYSLAEAYCAVTEIMQVKERSVGGTETCRSDDTCSEDEYYCTSVTSFLVAKNMRMLI